MKHTTTTKGDTQMDNTTNKTGVASMNERIKVSDKNIPAKIWREAEAISGGLYRTNAKYAIAYAFRCNEKEIVYGEFLSNLKREWENIKDFDGYISLK